MTISSAKTLADGETAPAASGTRTRSNAASPDQTEFNWRTIIKLDLQLGKVHLVDQFEWPLLPQSYANSKDLSLNERAVLPIEQPTPESFAKNLCAEIGVGGEFVPTVACAIREQLYQARINFDDAPKAFDLTVPPLRPSIEGEWEPMMEELSDGEIERRHKEQERTAR